MGVERSGMVCIALRSPIYDVCEACVERSTEGRVLASVSWQTRRGASDALSREARRWKSITLHGSAPTRYRQERIIATDAGRLGGQDVCCLLFREHWLASASPVEDDLERQDIESNHHLDPTCASNTTSKFNDRYAAYNKTRRHVAREPSSAR